MPNAHGDVIWYELMAKDPDAAQAFYGKVMPWTFAWPPGGTDRDYRVFSAPDADVGGLRKMPDGVGLGPEWLVYFGVDDVDVTTDRVKDLGGSVEIAPQDIPGIGRFAFVADPQGAHFYLMRGISDDSSTAYAPMTPGHCSWNELVTSDQTAALDFYGKLFGWTKLGAMPMGEMGDYTFIGTGETRLGAIMDAPQAGAKPFWNFAFQVAEIDAAARAVEDGGGRITQAPIELPEEGGWLIQTTDPEGAKVMFTGPRSR